MLNENLPACALYAYPNLRNGVDYEFIQHSEAEGPVISMWLGEAETLIKQPDGSETYVPPVSAPDPADIIKNVAAALAAQVTTVAAEAAIKKAQRDLAIDRAKIDNPLLATEIEKLR